MNDNEYSLDTGMSDTDREMWEKLDERNQTEEQKEADTEYLDAMDFRDHYNRENPDD